MKAQDLRLGNLVMYNYKCDRLAIVEEITRTTVTIKFLEKAEDEVQKVTVSPKDLIPFLITEKVLLKFGLKQDKIYKYRYSIETFHLHHMADFDTKKEWMLALDYGQFLSSYVSYAHQLQNLFFSLTQNELEFKV